MLLASATFYMHDIIILHFYGVSVRRVSDIFQRSGFTLSRLVGGVLSSGSGGGGGGSSVLAGMSEEGEGIGGDGVLPGDRQGRESGSLVCSSEQGHV